MNLEALFGSRTQHPVRLAIVGAGEFGSTAVAQALRCKALELVVVCDRNLERARQAILASGLSEEHFRFCDNRQSAIAALEAHRIALLEDSELIGDLPIEAVIEATGNPEAAARVCLGAIEHGIHSVMATKEAEVLVGPLLARKAQRLGIVHTTVDGDQPATLIGLISRVRTMGLTVVAAGKSTARDLVWDSQQDHVSVHGRIFQAPDYGRWFRLGESDVDSAIQARTVPGVPRHVAPDLCELTIVANNTGLDVDRADLHAPIARPVELPFFFRPRGEGGILSRIGVVDQFTCLRRSDEMSFAGGVFVVVEAPNPHTGEVLRDIDIPATPDGRYLLIHNPVHLLGVESPISVLTAARLGLPMGARDVVQRFDMIGRARRDFSAGEVFAFGSEWNIDGLDHLIEPAVSLSAGQPLPYWLAGGCRLKSPLAAGETLRFDHVELSTDSTLVRLRKEQDCMKL